jgi:hypothetical protein
MKLIAIPALVLALLGCAIAFFSVALAAGGNPPSGSYLQSCREISVKGDVLYADCDYDCSSHNCFTNHTHLNRVSRCIGDIGNSYGRLVCSRWSTQSAQPTQPTQPSNSGPDWSAWDHRLEVCKEGCAKCNFVGYVTCSKGVDVCVKYCMDHNVFGNT